MQGFEDMDLEEDKRDIINREIRMFRDMHKVRLVPEALLGIVLCSVLFFHSSCLSFQLQRKRLLPDKMQLHFHFYVSIKQFHTNCC